MQVFLKDFKSFPNQMIETQEQPPNVAEKNEDEILLENVKKNENLSEFCVLEGISDKNCEDPEKETQTCYINSCKHCCYNAVGGSKMCLSKCEAMKSLLRSH